MAGVVLGTGRLEPAALAAVIVLEGVVCGVPDLEGVAGNMLGLYGVRLLLLDLEGVVCTLGVDDGVLDGVVDGVARFVDLVGVVIEEEEGVFLGVVLGFVVCVFVGDSGISLRMEDAVRLLLNNFCLLGDFSTSLTLRAEALRMMESSKALGVAGEGSHVLPELLLVLSRPSFCRGVYGIAL